jgi:putative hydrolase of the HAD superfamily
VANALLFDLDDTLMVEERAAVAAFRATARWAAASHDLDPDALAVAARARARELWRGAPTYGYCLRVGISSSEGLWCRYDGGGRETRELRGWSSTYRREAWRLALAEQGVKDQSLAEELGERFPVERRARHEVFPDVDGALRALSAAYILGIVTNGASCLQRESSAPPAWPTTSRSLSSRLTWERESRMRQSFDERSPNSPWSER